MAFNFSKTLVNLFGSRNERMVKAYLQIALKAGDFEEGIKSLSDDQLKAKTAQFKDSIKNGTSPEELLPEAFAVVREAARRNVEMRHFDVQLVGGHVLYEGKIAEMATGEGKTLVATLAAYLVYLTGRKIHVVTVNDYLAKRDAEWMEPVYNALGLTVGAIQADMDTSGQERKDQYNRDITYGTNNEFGFDYLRDNMKVSIEQMAQGPLEYAIIDEVDSILIDEARTPLIISGPAFDDVTRYKKADSVCRQLLSLQSDRDKLKRRIDLTQREIANAEGELAEAKKAKDKSRAEAAQKVIEEKAGQLGGDEAKIETMTEYFEVEHDRKAVHLTHEGIGAAQDIAGVGSFFTGSTMDWPHLLEQGLRAHIVFEKEKEYVIMDGKIVIVDEFTGRLMQGRQWSDGLHQAVEAKEGVQVKEESQTLATITLQNFFKLYDQIAGMTGTAATEAEEFMNIYKLDVVVIPTNKPCARNDQDDEIYKSIKEKFNAIVEEIFRTSSSGRPVLVGTISIEKSEAISNALNNKYGLEHEVLNAKQHQREAAIVEKAGHQYKTRDNRMFGNVTIATNMAGRGTDIKLGDGVLYEVVKTEESTSEKGVELYTLKQDGTGNLISFKSTDPLARVFRIQKDQKWVGGLHIVGTERHESRRIDNQLRGRSGRQGDAGSSIFFLSFDDDLMRIFGGEKILKLLGLVGWKEDEPIYNPMISKQIAKIQKKVEERNFEARKSLLEYDEVMDYQRKIFYSRRRKLLKGIDLKETICEMIDSVLSSNCESVLDANYPYNCIVEWSRSTFGADLDAGRINGLKSEEIEEQIKNQAKKNIANEISLSLGEYLEDYEDRSTWNIESLCKWAMSAFGANLSASKLRHANPEEIEDILVEAASEQINKKDCSQIDEFLKEDFALKTIAHWASSKFDINVSVSGLTGLKPGQVLEYLTKLIEEKYTQREISYPVDFAMNMAFGSDGPNAYGLEALVDWANKKYLANLSSDQLREMPPKTIYKKLIEYSQAYNNGKLAEEIDPKIGSCSKEELLQWATERFEATLEEADIEDDEAARENITYAAKQFLRKELADLEKYVLLQIYDGTWKDHLYAMDHLKESIFLRAFAEKDPKVEYKHEGFKMFNEMLATTEDKVAGTIFKVHIAPNTQRRNVWNVSAAKHDEVDQFSMAERQRAAATAPQGEQKVKQIKLDQPKVGRNEPCPCGSGKKYKKCCGRNA
ncbi:MAG: preprotein translocase subunit SecA [Sedimentisphaerales bacterium]|nr:preprotein translocase subunit SecA [Sedimentisphaerales bacterium]